MPEVEGMMSDWHRAAVLTGVLAGTIAVFAILRVAFGSGA